MGNIRIENERIPKKRRLLVWGTEAMGFFKDQKATKIYFTDIIITLITQNKEF